MACVATMLPRRGLFLGEGNGSGVGVEVGVGVDEGDFLERKSFFIAGWSGCGFAPSSLLVACGLGS